MITESDGAHGFQGEVESVHSGVQGDELIGLPGCYGVIDECEGEHARLAAPVAGLFILLLAGRVQAIHVAVAVVSGVLALLLAAVLVIAVVAWRKRRTSAPIQVG